MTDGATEMLREESQVQTCPGDAELADLQARFHRVLASRCESAPSKKAGQGPAFLAGTRGFLTQASNTLQDRATDYDTPDGEESLPLVTEVFNLITRDGKLDSPARAALFMTILKLVRSQQGDYRRDNFVDGPAYFAMTGYYTSKESGK